MIRRFVNLVLQDSGSRMHSLHRLDVAKYLFYPSTAQAEAANAKNESNNGGGGGGDKTKATKPPRIRRMRRLPKPSMSFFPFATATDDDDEEEPDPWPSVDDSFILFRPGTNEGRILHATDRGRTIVYDADAHAVSPIAPTFPEPMGWRPIAFSVPGAGGFMQEKESLYVMRSTIRPPPPKHNRYDPSPKEKDDGCSGDFVVLDFNEPYEWQRLPRPPFAPDGRFGSHTNMEIISSTVVDGGRTICVSVSPWSSDAGVADDVERTYCLDTATRKWRHAGDWALPFDGRAEYVPELGTWIGLSSSPPHHLCASDLAAAMADAHRVPTPQHVWDDFTPPPDKDSSIVLNRRYPQYVLHRSTEWSPAPLGQSLVNLGSGRFCILKVFDIRRSEWAGSYEPDMHMPKEKEFTLLTGVEVVRCHDGEGGLRMVKHKSRRCEFDSNHWLL